ncbi:MAG: class I SAM-dependent methyltransferase [Candidatus Sulfotelmatobacter sp.]
MIREKEKISDVQSCYDLVAKEYARRIYDELQAKPLDRQLLDRFAASVRGQGLTCDLGCGPGQVARYLQARGLEVCGMDLSPGMVARARELNPQIPFDSGDMRALPVSDDRWAGIAAFYAIVNLSAPGELSQALREMKRVLAPGGRLLISFHIGDDASQVEDMWDHGTALAFTFFRVSTVVEGLRAAGFEIEEIIEREPYAPEVEYQSRRAYIFAQRPGTTIASV